MKFKLFFLVAIGIFSLQNFSAPPALHIPIKNSSDYLVVDQNNIELHQNGIHVESFPSSLRGMVYEISAQYLKSDKLNFLLLSSKSMDIGTEEVENYTLIRLPLETAQLMVNTKIYHLEPLETPDEWRMEPDGKNLLAFSTKGTGALTSYFDLSTNLDGTSISPSSSTMMSLRDLASGLSAEVQIIH